MNKHWLNSTWPECRKNVSAQRPGTEVHKNRGWNFLNRDRVEKAPFQGETVFIRNGCLHQFVNIRYIYMTGGRKLFAPFVFWTLKSIHILLPFHLLEYLNDNKKPQSCWDVLDSRPIVETRFHAKWLWALQLTCRFFFQSATLRVFPEIITMKNQTMPKNANLWRHYSRVNWKESRKWSTTSEKKLKSWLPASSQLWWDLCVPCISLYM